MSKNQSSIYSNRVWINGELKSASILMSDGMIVEIEESKIADAIDYSGYVIMPGVIDAHVHINEPGRTAWEGFNTATRAAAAGGITTVIDMPLNSSPVVINQKAFHDKIKASKAKLHVNCGFWGGAVDDNIEDILSLIEAGCLGIKVFLSDSGLKEFPNITLDDLEKVMRALSKYDVPLLAHCEIDTLPADHDLETHPRSYQSYLNSRPKAWENQAISDLLSLSEETGCRVHIVHLASDQAISIIKKYKASGLDFSVETCPHYLFFNSEKIEDGDTLLKCAPPIRDIKNQSNLKQALRDGVIDLLSTDHSPAPLKLKEIESGDFRKAWGGIAGLQFLLPASWTTLKGTMSLESFIPLLTSRPAALINKSNSLGKIRVGYQADFCIWNPDETFLVTESIIEHRHKISPYINHELYGKTMATYVNGSLIYNEGNIVQLNKGKVILRKKEMV